MSPVVRFLEVVEINCENSGSKRPGLHITVPVMSLGHLLWKGLDSEEPVCWILRTLLGLRRVYAAKRMDIYFVVSPGELYITPSPGKISGKRKDRATMVSAV